MKQFLAAFLAALMLLLCGCAAKPAAETAQTEVVPVEAAAAEILPAEAGPAAEEEILPDEAAPAEESVVEETISGGDWAFTCVTDTLQADVEEVVSYAIDRPYITTGDAAADAALEAKISELTAQFVGNCENDIYVKAQSLPAMAIVTITCDARQEESLLKLNYEMQTEYRLSDPDAGEDPVSKGQRVVVYDLATGVFSEEG